MQDFVFERHRTPIEESSWTHFMDMCLCSFVRGWVKGTRDAELSYFQICTVRWLALTLSGQQDEWREWKGAWRGWHQQRLRLLRRRRMRWFVWVWDANPQREHYDVVDVTEPVLLVPTLTHAHNRHLSLLPVAAVFRHRIYASTLHRQRSLREIANEHSLWLMIGRSAMYSAENICWNYRILYFM